jgi:predicted enzyme related to lactoylglutathione lyase
VTVVDRHEEGTFCWIEIAATDQAGLDFYPRLFGWDADTQPVPGGSYTLFFLGGRPVAGGFLLGEQQIADGMPAHWNMYVNVADVDATVRRATALGATLRIGPMDIPKTGRTAAITDPTGAVVCLWQAAGHIGFHVRDEPGTFAWPELITPDTEGAARFYGELFGWTADEPIDMGGPSGPYTILRLGEGSAAGLSRPPVEGVGPAWFPYFEVADCDAAAAAAADLGAHVHVGPLTIEGAGRFAALGDPDDADFCIIRSQASS